MGTGVPTMAHFTTQRTESEEVAERVFLTNIVDGGR